MSTPPRSTPAQQGPPPNLADLPTTTLQGRSWFREHQERPGTGAGCWYYAPLPTDPTRGGRFDLPEPEGTCYFADAEVVAAMERVGVFTAKGKPVPADNVTDRVISQVDPGDLPAGAADLLAPQAATAFRVTGELFTMQDSSVPQHWARASRAAGHDALTYTPRFSPFGRAVAVFGASGPRAQATTGRRSLAQVLAGEGIRIAPIPRTTGMTFVQAP